MSNVVNLADARRAKLKSQGLSLNAGKGPDPRRASYFCLTCEGDMFHLYQDGGVHCAHCGARIRNLVQIKPV